MAWLETILLDRPSALFAAAEPMGWFEAIFLGVLQGLTEFLPISSSGHLSIFEYFLGLEETDRFFDLMLHVGTLLAVLLYYRNEPRRLLAAARQSSADSRNIWRIGFFVILATLPTVAAAVVFQPSDPIAQSPTDADLLASIGNLREFSSNLPWVVLTFMVMTGFVLLVGSRATGGTVDASSMRWWHALVVGISQMMSALCPGLSRSGMTVSSGMLVGLRGEWAVHFSLLMSCVAIVGGAVKKFDDVDSQWLRANWPQTVVGSLCAALVGWFCITLLVKAVRGGRWWWFSIYVWSFAAVASVMLVVRGE